MEWLFGKQKIEDNETLKIKFEEFINWFELEIAKHSCVEMDGFNSNIEKIIQSINILHQLSIECKLQFSGISSPQVNHKLSKLWDTIEYTAQIFNVPNNKSTNVIWKLSTLLPDVELIKDFLAKLKPKLKAVEEFSGMKMKANKNTNNSSKENKQFGTQTTSVDGKKIFDIISIKVEAKKVLILCDQLEQQMVKNSLLEYFGTIKQSLHLPFDDLMLRISSAPSSIQSKKQIDQDYDHLQKADEIYNISRHMEILMKMSTLKYEIEFLETLCNNQLNEIKNQILKSNLKLQQFSLYKLLKYFMELSLPDLLHHILNNEINWNEFCSCTQDCQQYFNNNISAKSSENENILIEFDFELFYAYAEDWKDRILQHNNLMKSDEFIKGYKQLVNTKQHYQKCRNNYERNVKRHEIILMEQKELEIKLDRMKSHMEEVCNYLNETDALFDNIYALMID